MNQWINQSVSLSVNQSSNQSISLGLIQATWPVERKKQEHTRTRDVLPYINRTQAAEVTPGSDGMIPSAAAWRHLQRARYNASCSKTDHSVAAEGWCQFTTRCLSLVTLTFDLWPWHWNMSQRGNKHVFPVNLAEIRSAVSETSDSQTKWKKNNKVADSARNRTLHSLLHVVVKRTTIQLERKEGN